MNPNSISHRLFIAALQPTDPPPGRRPAATLGAAGYAAAKTNAPKSTQSFAAPPPRRTAEWSWSGWQQNTI